MLKRTPCVGACSTTYGDLVCRGCKRFSHEIVGWNGFDGEQRRMVWERLLSLRSGATAAVVEVVDEARVRSSSAALGVADAAQFDCLNLLYEALQRLQWRERGVTLAELGVRLLAANQDPAAGDAEPGELLARIDQEFYRRSLAQYERNFRISPL
ncbi:MAG: DUF1289 domain-containing protein [Pseudomonadales bacterium]